MDGDEAYFDTLADVYDDQYRELTDDIDFYVDRAKRADGPVLELGCGTGRVYLELLAAGVDADGLDLSEPMLAELREKAVDRDLNPSVWRGDMSDFEVGREYALVIVPFRAYLHLTTIDEQLGALDSVYDALAPEGELVLNFFAPDFALICEHYGVPETTTVERDGEELTLETVTQFGDELEQVARIRSELRDSDGVVVAESDTGLKLVSKREFELLLRCSPFEEWAVHGGFDFEPLQSTRQEMIWVVER